LKKGFFLSNIIPVKRFQLFLKKSFVSGLSILLLVPILLAFGCAPQPKSLLNQDKIKKGEKIYSERCLSCHGPQGKGGLGPSLVSPQIKKALKETEEGSEVEKTILKGRGKMPSFEKEISHLDLHNLLEYILSIQKD